MKPIERTDYLSKLKSLVGTPDLKIITGVRRAAGTLCKKVQLMKVEKLQKGTIIDLVFFW